MKKLTLTVMMMLIMFCAVPVLAQVPTLINFQGKLTDSTQAPVDGNVDVICYIYDAETGGILLWAEEYAGVFVENGIFNILLGNGSSLSSMPIPL